MLTSKTAFLALVLAVPLANIAHSQTLSKGSGLEGFGTAIGESIPGLGESQTGIDFDKDENFNLVKVRGSFSSTAAGNLLNVVIEGSNNTAIVNAEQQNSGNVNSELILNGKIDF